MEPRSCLLTTVPAKLKTIVMQLDLIFILSQRSKMWPTEVFRSVYSKGTRLMVDG